MMYKFVGFVLGSMTMMTVGVAVAAEKAPATAESAPAHRGFQLGVRTGVMFPFGSLGKITESAPVTALSDTVTWQVPVHLDIGFKPSQSLFLGGYVGLSAGPTGGSLKEACKRSGASCATAGFRLGIEAAWSFIPAGKVDPWVGVGLGLEGFGVGVEDPTGEAADLAFVGFEFLQLSGGAEFRLSEYFGIGPLVSLSLGRYGSVSQTVQAQTVETDMAETALHGWATLGVKGTLFP